MKLVMRKSKAALVSKEKELAALKYKYQNDWIFDPELREFLTKILNSKEEAQKTIDEWNNERFPHLQKSFNKLEYFRKKLLEHLDSLKDDDVMQKSKAAQIGETRTRRGGIKFKKIGDGKWRKVYDNQTRGANMAVAAIRRKIAAAKDEHEIMQIILLHRDRFSDNEGHPLPFVQELSEYIKMQGEAKTAAAAKTKKPAPKAKPQKMAASKASPKKKEEIIAADDKTIEDYEKMGAEDFKAGKKRVPPHPGDGKWDILSPQSKDANKKMEAWLKGFDKANIAELIDDEPAPEKKESENEKLSEGLKNKFEELAVPMEQYEFTQENYNKLFPNKKVKTPLGDVKLGDNQYKKLKAKYRKDYLGAVHQTLSAPVVVVETEKNGKKSKLYTKSFKVNDETKAVISVVVSIEGESVSISTHRRDMNNMINLIKKGNILYEKDIASTVDAGTFNSSSSEEQQPTPTIYSKTDEKSITEQENEEATSNEPEESEEEKRRNRSEGMKGNQNAKKDGAEEVKPQTDREREEEIKGKKKARKDAGLPELDEGERVSAAKDTTWNPNSEDYRFKDTGYIRGSRKENAQSYIRKKARDGEQVTNETIDWTGIEENEVAAAEIITKQNLMGKPDWEGLQKDGMTGGAGYLINELYKTINSKPKFEQYTSEAKNTYQSANFSSVDAMARLQFSIGLDTLKSRLETCKTMPELIEVVGEINGEITGNYISSKKTPEYLKLAKDLESVNKKIDAEIEVIRKEIYAQGNPFEAADKFLKENMGIRFGVDALIDKSGAWKGSYYDRWGKKELIKLLEAGQAEYKARRAAIEKERGVDLSEMHEYSLEISQKKFEAVREKNKELEQNNTMAVAWDTLGKSFKKAVDVITTLGNEDTYKRFSEAETFAKHYQKAATLENDDFSWTEKKSTGGGNTGPRKTQFELQVADKIERKGGRSIKIDSTEGLKQSFNLRDVQSGNWVLKDVKSAKFHVENVAMGLSDLADITGIPDNLVSLNGRLAIALGARGKGKALAHYEPVERVINITKMRGGGSLGHEWFHAFDNLIADAMTGGRYNIFLSETGKMDDLTPRQKRLVRNMEYYKRWGETRNYEIEKEKARKAGVKVDQLESGEEHIAAVKSVFSKLTTAMMTGSATKTENITYSKSDLEYANSSNGEYILRNLQISKEHMDFEGALKRLEESRYSSINKKNKEQMKRIIAAYYGGEHGSGTLVGTTKETTSHFFENAKKLDSNPDNPYWSDIKEMGARAFSAYLNDKMAERGMFNNYLSHATANSDYTGHSPYPDGEERKAINTAFDELFRVINESGAIRKAIEAENAWRLMGGRQFVIDNAVNGAIRFFRKLQDGIVSFEKKKVVLQRSLNDITCGDAIEQAIEDYRWVAEEAPTVPIFSQEIKMVDNNAISKESDFSPVQEYEIQGMKICIENPKGTVRCGVDKDNHPWSIKMGFPYGEITGTMGCDGDPLDCYIGQNPESDKVFIINQNDPVTEEFDEQKVMLGFNTGVEAVVAYLSQYDRPGFFGSMDEMLIDEFKEKAYAKENKWSRIE